MKGITFIPRNILSEESLLKLRAAEERKKLNMEKRIKEMKEDFENGKFNDIIKSL